VRAGGVAPDGAFALRAGAGSFHIIFLSLGLGEL
jgi:hypothetical protein